jgi:cytidylate kinase
VKNITITGDLGSGKSSVTAILKEKLKYEVISVGTVQRKLAEKYGINSIEAFNKYMETHPEIDTECDEMVAELGRQSGLIFDSRLAWHFVENSFKVYLSVDEDVAIKRIFFDQKRINESHLDLEQTRISNRKRRESEVARFKSLYNVDMNDFANYDLVIDTSALTPEEVAEQILEVYFQD